MPPEAIFIACFRDGAVRPSGRGSDARQRFRTPALPVVRRLLVDSGGVGFDERVLALRHHSQPDHVYDIHDTAPSDKAALPLIALALVDNQGHQGLPNRSQSFINNRFAYILRASRPVVHPTIDLFTFCEPPAQSSSDEFARSVFKLAAVPKQPAPQHTFDGLQFASLGGHRLRVGPGPGHCLARAVMGPATSLPQTARRIRASD